MKKKNIMDNIWGFTFILPILIVFGIFRFYPAIRTVILSLMDYNLTTHEWTGLSNYGQLMGDQIFWKSIKTTFLYALGNVPICTLLSFVLASLIFPLRKGLGSFFKMAFYVPSVASVVALGIVWAWLYDPNSGFFNYLLSIIGIEPVMWLANSKLALISLIFKNIVTSQGAGVIIYIAVIGGIPKSLYDSFHMESNSKFKELIHVTFPLVKSATLYLLVINTISAFQQFTDMYVMTGGGPNYATTTTVYLIYETAFKSYRFGLASAQGILLTIFIIAVSFFQFKYFKSENQY